MQLQLFVEEITRLHNEIEGYLNKSLENALEIGAKLDQVKADLIHGEFTGWVEDNLPFTPRTARNYMKLYENRDKLETSSVSSIGEAYKLLREPGKTETVSVLEYDDIDRAIADLSDLCWHKWNGDIWFFTEKHWNFLHFLREIKRRGRANEFEKSVLRKEFNTDGDYINFSFVVGGWCYLEIERLRKPDCIKKMMNEDADIIAELLKRNDDFDDELVGRIYYCLWDSLNQSANKAAGSFITVKEYFLKMAA